MSRATTIALAMVLAVPVTVVLGLMAFLFMPGGHEAPPRKVRGVAL